MVFFAKNFDRGHIHSGINGINNDSFHVDVGNNMVGCDAEINGTAIDVWHHAVMVVTTSWFKIYIDGKEVASKNQDMNFNASNSRELIIGRLAQQWYPFHGCIDEFFVYNRVLSDAEVAALFRGEKSYVSQPPQIANASPSNNTQNGDKASLGSNNEIPSKEVGLTKGLVAYYPFEGDAMDMSGNKNNGRYPKERVQIVMFTQVVIPGLKFDTGHKGKCCRFPSPEYSRSWGEYVNSNPYIYVRVPNSNSLKFNDAVSFSFWFKLDDNGGGRYFGMKDGKVVPNSGFVKFFSKVSENGQIHAGINLNQRCIELYNNNDLCSAPIQLDTKWNHAVMVVTKSHFKIYLNGIEVASKDKNMSFDASNKCDLYIGCIPNLKREVNKYAYNGCLDEFFIYNRELTSAEVDALFKGEEPDQDYLAYKRALVAPLKDEIDYLKSCTDDNYRKGIEDEIVDNKTNNVADIVYCNDNYPDLADRLEDKMLGFVNSISDCETYLKYYPESKQQSAIEDKMFGLINSVPDCNTYLNYFSTKKRGAAFEEKMYQCVDKAVDVNDCETYIKLFPKGKHKSAVVAHKNEIVCYNAAKNGGKAECTTYLQKYPKGRYVSEIQSKVDDMSRPPVVKTTSSDRYYETQKIEISENEVMDYVASIEKDKENDDRITYEVHFKDGKSGWIEYNKDDGKWGGQIGYYFLDANFYYPVPNSKSAAILKLYRYLHPD